MVISYIEFAFSMLSQRPLMISYGLLSIKWTKKVLTLSHFFLPRDSIRVTWRPPHKGTDLK